MGTEAFSIKVWDVLHSKNFLILLLFLMATGVSLWLVSTPTPSFRNIMSSVNDKKSYKNPPVYDHPKEFNIDETYLQLLGFTSSPKIYPKSYDKNLNPPVVITQATSNNYKNSFALLNSVRRHMPNHSMVIYDLGIGTYELLKIKQHCNETSKCRVKSFDFNKYPGHIRDLSIEAYKPLIIQLALVEYGFILWTNALDYIISDNISSVITNTNRSGITAWSLPSGLSTSALTHYGMFNHFQVKPKSYYFHHAVDSAHLALLNNARVHRRLMLPWVRCALKLRCIAPRGAQSSGCDYTRKPHYLYTGCHRHATSALNLILGRLFGTEPTPTHRPYICPDCAMFGTDPPPTTVSSRETAAKTGAR